MDSPADLLTALVAIDSTNPDLVPGGAGEAGIARFIAGWLEARGLDVRLQEAAPGRPNVIAVAHGSGGGPSLLLNGHMDTVGRGEFAAAHQPRLEAGRLYGRGAYDMKGGLAACMLAAAAAAQRPLRGDLILTAVVDEEYASLGTEQALRTVRAEAAIVAEFTELRLVLAHKGFTWFDIETRGRAAHGSRPDLGVDAIAHMGRLLVDLEALGRDLQKRPAHPLLGTGSLHASTIHGGREMSSYPERCTLAVERRTLPGEQPETLQAELEQLIRREAEADPTFEATVRPGLSRSPLETDQAAPLAQAVAEAARQALGHPPDVAGVPFWTDAALLAQAGIPSVLFGPSGLGAHAAEEWVDVASVEACAQVYLRAAEAFCGQVTPGAPRT